MTLQPVLYFLFLFSIALGDLANYRTIHFLMMSSHLFFLSGLSSSPFHSALQDDHFSLRLFIMVRRSSCGPMACWIFAPTRSFVTWSLYEICNILWLNLISVACILLCSSAVRVHDSQAYRKMNVTRERISRILELTEMLLSFQTGFNLVNAAVVCAILETTRGLDPHQIQ